MSTTQPPPKKLRKRSKSFFKENSPSTDAELAPDLNGDDAAAKPKAEPETDVPAAPKEDKDKSESNDAPNPGRKRKASEMKDNSVSETSESVDDKDKDKTETPTETPPESEIKPEVKEEEKVAEESATENKEEIKLPPKQTFGKGKRARIPNKRYSDILLSPRTNHSDNEIKPKKPAVENGVIPEDTEKPDKENTETSDSKSDLSIDSPSLSSLKRSNTSISSGSPASKKSKVNVDLTNPNYLKPFKYGWKRELVYRATSDNSTKRNGDIYYYTPSGKKVRSMREVSEHLKNKELTLDDFTFFKEPLGLDDPEKEIIRDAKYKSAGFGGPVSRKSLSKAKTTKISSPKTSETTSTDTSPTNTSTESTKPKASPRISNLKIKFPTTRGQNKLSKQDKKPKDEDMEIGTYAPNWTSPTKKSTSKWNDNVNAVDNKPCRPCSIRCQGVVGLIPTLQCRVCLCLFHNECVGLAPHTVVQGYVCKNCQLEQEPTSDAAAVTPAIAPPPLTPINTLKAGTAAQPSIIPPKLQRIPRPDDIHPPPPPRLTPRPPAVSQTETRSLVGGVTTWFPHSATIQVGGGVQLRPAHSGAVRPPRPQAVEFICDKKYLIIPKHSVLSVSPTIAAAAACRLEETVSTPVGDGRGPSAPDSARLGPESQIKTESVDGGGDLNAKKASASEEGGTDEKAADVAQEENESKTAKSKKSPRSLALPSAPPKTEEGRYMDNCMQNTAYFYNTLLYAFQYLKVQDLLRAGCVCALWRDIASHPSLWRTVRMKNSQVHSFEGLANTLKSHGTVHLDLRKMLLPNGGDEVWPSFSQAIKNVDSLRKIELCRCPASVVEQLPESNPKLEVINAVTIKCESMSLAPFKSLVNLKELRVKSTVGLNLTSDLSALKELKTLKHLSLTSIKDLHLQNIEVIAELENLESLDMGECTDFPKTFGNGILAKLNKLEKLRLEKGQGNCYTFEILEAVKNMPRLEQLELVNFDIKTGFDKALGACTNIKKLLIIPTYISQSATTNHMVLGGVLRLRSTLSHFVWGVTLELLRVTELFVDQCEDPEKKEKKEKKMVCNGDSIPVLKPVPLLTDNQSEILPALEPPQVEIVPLPNLQKLLLQSLPTTRVKILKIPFHATWRQSITDTVN